MDPDSENYPYACDVTMVLLDTMSPILNWEQRWE